MPRGYRNNHRRPSKDNLIKTMERLGSVAATCKHYEVCGETLRLWRKHYGMKVKTKQKGLMERLESDLDKIVEDYVFFNKSMQMIADQEKCSKSVIQRLLENNEVSRAYKSKVLKGFEDDMGILAIKFLKQDWSIEEIAEEWECPEQFLVNLFTKQGWIE